MNEQIKAMMGQTLDEKFSGTWSTMDMQDLQKFTERFAELIVQECEKVINGNIMYQANKGVITNIHGLNQARELIKHHFGVK